MNDYNVLMQRTLQMLQAGRPLARLVDQVLDEYPDPQALALDQARQILFKHTRRRWDPRQVWWHQFNDASSSSRSFTGWQHSGPSGKSMRFPELMLSRFDLGFQDASDELDVYGGFYRQGPQVAFYDERNEVPMLARDVQKDFWALDFAELYRRKVSAFWDVRGDDFCVVAKVNWLGQCARALEAGHITQADAVGLRGMVCAELRSLECPPTLELLRQGSAAGTLQVGRLAWREDQAPFLYVLGASEGPVVLFRPWASEAMRGFASAEAMGLWLRDEMRQPQALALYVNAASVDNRDPEHVQEVRGLFQRVAGSATGLDALQRLAPLRVRVRGDLFSHFGEVAKRQMQRDAARMMDNKQLREAMLKGYLGAFLKVFGVMAPLGWPLSLLLLGASLIRVGLDIDQAVHASRASQRKAALREAVMDTLFAALNLVDLSFRSSFALLAYRAPFHELEASLQQWQVAGNASVELQAVEANAELEGMQPGTGSLQGIRIDAEGACWVELGGMPYRVRYSTELSSWLIVPPDNPFAFAPLRPIRQNAGGDWELLSTPGLKGGNPPQPSLSMSSERSAFWDEYMSTDAARKEQTSELALERQRRLLDDWDIPAVAEGEDLLMDEHDIGYVDDNGSRAYVYQEDGGYASDVLRLYTDEGTQANTLLREGRHVIRFMDDDAYLELLCETLDGLPSSDEVPLYRGGFGGRGTSGAHFRNQALKVGDVLVNTDMTSFTENPYIIREFAADKDQLSTLGREGLFDDTSVVFELPAKQYSGGTPIAALSITSDEAETLFQPGHYWRINKLVQVKGDDFQFVHVTLSEVSKPTSGPVYDLRTGEVFDRAQYLARIKSEALAGRFFPL
ncbi:dermonecrotic toxin domain-containing protein [Pseudomonas plecoglossicida]|uniref:dermonecrotic toxin domain-containing protein n=1 Tax=Pseudomonas plecoglossicida TaxID=70775 RepID=UPI00048B33E2|nr:DUF6543 domain-containing protein [Pseudomonas plecoglossicida]GLR37384.1 hypothetical protein GCM10011247_27810 [Pseudomonas plecoglossicida]